MSLASVIISEVALVLLQAWLHCAIPLYQPSHPEDLRCHRDVWRRAAEDWPFLMPTNADDFTPNATYDPLGDFWHYSHKRLDRGLLWALRPEVFASAFREIDIARVRQGAWLSRPLDRSVRLLQLDALPLKSSEEAEYLGLYSISRYLREPRQVRWRKWRRRAPALEGIILATADEQVLILSTIQLDWLGSTDRSDAPSTQMHNYVQEVFQIGWAWASYLDPQPFAFDPRISPWDYPRSKAIVLAWVAQRDLLAADAPPVVPSPLLREFDDDEYSPGYCGHDDRCAWTYITGPEGGCNFGLWPPIARSWVPTATPLFSLDGTWFGFAAGVFLLGQEIKSPHPLLACHDAHYSVLQAVCVPRFLRAPRCARGW